MNKQKRVPPPSASRPVVSRGTRMRMLSKSTQMSDFASLFVSANNANDINACDPSKYDYWLGIRKFDIDNFNDVLESLIYDNKTITLKFRQDKGFKNIKMKESNTNINLPEFIGTAENVENPFSIYIGVYFLPKGKELKDCIKFDNASYKQYYYYIPLIYDCDDFYEVIVPYDREVYSLGPSTTPDKKPNPEGLLTFKIENQGYTGISGNRRLYIHVSYNYREEAPDFGFYVD
jgi:hypothetical protein